MCVFVCVREECLDPACVTRLTIYDMHYVNVGAKTVRRS